MGDFDKAGDDVVQDPIFSFDGSTLGVDGYAMGSFDQFSSLGPEGQPAGFPTLDLDCGFQHLSDSAFSRHFAL